MYRTVKVLLSIFLVLWITSTQFPGSRIGQDSLLLREPVLPQIVDGAVWYARAKCCLPQLFTVICLVEVRCVSVCVSVCVYVCERENVCVCVCYDQVLTCCRMETFLF